MITCLLLTACSGPLSILDPAGPSARDAAMLWWGMFIFFTFALVVISALWFYAMYRPSGETPAHDPTGDVIHRRWIIGGGVVLPVATIVVILAFGIPAGGRMKTLTHGNTDVLTVNVTGHQWRWEITYPDTDGRSVLTNEIHIPVDTPVRLLLSSADVIHAFWVPRLGGKLDAVPGRVNELQLQASETGVYQGVCAEFCGLGHTQMRFEVYVHTRESFAMWQQEQERE